MSSHIHPAVRVMASGLLQLLQYNFTV